MSLPGQPPPYSPPPYSPPPYSPPQGATVVQFQPVPNPSMHPITVVQVGRNLGSQPSMMVCQSCQYQILTRTETVPSTQTHIWAICLLVFGCWPCMWVPYCTPSCMTVNHYCPNCNAYLGHNQ